MASSLERVMLFDRREAASDTNKRVSRYSLPTSVPLVMRTGATRADVLDQQVRRADLFYAIAHTQH